MADMLADAVAELYQGDPEEFMARRGELVAQAREAGQAAVAKQIGALRKPTRSAWVVNRLVRADPEVTTRLAALAAELRDTGPSMDGGRIRELTAARAQLVDELTRQALDDLPATPAAVREEVRATFDAALADPEVAANLGTLVRAAHWAGFGLAPALPIPGSGAPASPPPAAKTKKPAPAEASAERERRHREKIISAERAVADADRAADAANAAERELEDAVRRLEAELAQARQQLADARRQAYRAESQQRRAGETLSRLRE
ncbi:MAG TPA: hypothetical protein VJ371_01220 [Streptosporangiaceae bacterium]|nr:hypothetical protein [Streptosporangiaceae bacterium]